MCKTTVILFIIYNNIDDGKRKSQRIKFETPYFLQLWFILNLYQGQFYRILQVHPLFTFHPFDGLFPDIWFVFYLAGLYLFLNFHFVFDPAGVGISLILYFVFYLGEVCQTSVLIGFPGIGLPGTNLLRLFFTLKRDEFRLLT